MAFDLDKVIAEREANQETPFTFTFDGDEYTMPADLDTRALNFITEGDLTGGMRLILGDEQWDRIVEAPATLGALALSDLFGAYMNHLGVEDVGESQASTRSLKSTARPSKRTSKGSTGSVSRTSAVR